MRPIFVLRLRARRARKKRSEGQSKNQGSRRTMFAVQEPAAPETRGISPT